MEEIIVAYQKLIKEIGFECLSCGKCCYTTTHPTTGLKNVIPILNREVETIRRHGKMYGVVPYHKINGIGGYIKTVKDNKCIYLDRDKRCKINDYKPLVCMIHPFQAFTTPLGGNMLDMTCLWFQKHPRTFAEPTRELIKVYRDFCYEVQLFIINNKIDIFVFFT